MLRAERLRAIADYAYDMKNIRVADLSNELGVTPVTIRRDLEHLSRLGVLEREHGGAVALRALESEFSRRMQENRLAKQAIARRAAQLVVDGATIVIDSGSTTALFARELQDKSGLTVITNAFNIAVEMAEYSDASVIVTGGILRRNTLGGVGDVAVKALNGIRADIVFLATSGIAKDGLTYPSMDEVSVKQAMIRSAASVVLLADSSKFGKVSLAVFASLEQIDQLVTDAAPEGETEDLGDALKQAAVQTIIAPPL
jgi:DeoR family fructose operon transcriptional repressor